MHLLIHEVFRTTTAGVSMVSKTTPSNNPMKLLSSKVDDRAIIDPRSSTGVYKAEVRPPISGTRAVHDLLSDPGDYQGPKQISRNSRGLMEVLWDAEALWTAPCRYVPYLFRLKTALLEVKFRQSGCPSYHPTDRS